MREILIGKPLHWLLLLVIIGVLVWLGVEQFHVRHFNLFITCVLTVTVAAVLIVVFDYRPGERITREPFDEA